MILEAIISTINENGELHVRPMGPKVDSGLPGRFLLRPYRTSMTYRNLKARREGVLHVMDDALLLAKSVLDQLDVSQLATRPAEKVFGRVLLDSCQYYEFQVTDLDDSGERTEIWAETVASGQNRPFFGWNRAKHAVLEAAILATRVAFLPLDEMIADYEKLFVLVEKTGGPAEFEAFRLLDDYVRGIAKRQASS